MPLRRRWSPCDRPHIVENVPEKRGVYELKCFGELVYIGYSSNLQQRLLSHCRSKNPNYYRFKRARFFRSAKALEDKHLSKFEREHGRLPRWNKIDTRAHP